MGNGKKHQQLGESYGTASNKLRKSILFEMLRRLGLDVCFQCRQQIETIRELSIEHKVAWLDSSNPVAMFFDMENIAFSHLSCNISAGRRNRKYASVAERHKIRNAMRPTTRAGRKVKNCRHLCMA